MNKESTATIALAIAGTAITGAFLALFWASNFNAVGWAFTGIVCGFYTIHKLSTR